MSASVCVFVCESGRRSRGNIEEPHTFTTPTPKKQKTVVPALYGNILQRQKRNRIVYEQRMKTLTSCELLRVTDGCISMWELQMQRRSDMPHVDKAHQIAVLNINQVVGFFSLFYFLFFAHNAETNSVRPSLVSHCDAKITAPLLGKHFSRVLWKKTHYSSSVSDFLWQALLNCALEFRWRSFLSAVACRGVSLSQQQSKDVPHLSHA